MTNYFTYLTIMKTYFTPYICLFKFYNMAIIKYKTQIYY
jgi:hypothetical protein